MNNNVEDYAMISIGVDLDQSGEPLIKADGKLLGTVGQVKELIERYEDEALSARVISIVRDAQRRRIL